MYSHINIELDTKKTQALSALELTNSINIGDVTFTHPDGRSCKLSTACHTINAEANSICVLLGDDVYDCELSLSEFEDFNNLKIEVYASFESHVDSSWSFGDAILFAEDEDRFPDGIKIDIEGIEFNECDARTIGSLLLGKHNLYSIPDSYDVTVRSDDGAVCQTKFHSQDSTEKDMYPFFQAIERCVNIDTREPHILSVLGHNPTELQQLMYI